MAGTRGLIASVLAAAQCQNQVARVMVEILSASPLRYTTWHPGVLDSSQEPAVWYTPRGMELGDLEHEELGGTVLELAIDDTDCVLYALDRSEELTSLDLHLWLQVRDADAGPWKTVYDCTWRILDALTPAIGTAYQLTIGVGGGRHPRDCGIEGSRECPHDFKGVRCQYAGATASCNKTWTACAALANTAHFVGARRAAEPGETLIFTTVSGEYVHYVSHPPPPPPVQSPPSPQTNPTTPSQRRPTGRRRPLPPPPTGAVSSTGGATS